MAKHYICRICKRFVDIPFGNTCTECMLEIHPPEDDLPDSENMPLCDLREEEH
jgi:hypothetical protein